MAIMSGIPFLQTGNARENAAPGNHRSGVQLAQAQTKGAAQMILVRDYMERMTACLVVIVLFPLICAVDWLLGKDTRND